MNKILIFSDNENLITFCSVALTPGYQLDTVDVILPVLTAGLIIVDANKITQNKTLFSPLNQQSIPFLIVGNRWSDSQQIEALTYGAAGYCEKTISPKLFMQAVQSILQGDVWVPRHLVSKIISSLVEEKRTAGETLLNSTKITSENLLSSLTNRELDVAKKISLGESNKAIATSLSISERTVKAHLTSIFKKTKVGDRLHLALFIKEFD